MTNNHAVTAKYLAYNQGVTTKSPVNSASSSTSAQTGYQQSARQLTAPSQTALR